MADLDVLLSAARDLEGFDDPLLRHLTSPLSLRDYVRMADEVASAVRGPRLLDWGCGYGQLSYLLRRRGLDVVSYDVGRALHDERVPFARELEAVRGRHPHWLPFRSEAFDAVLACGVLEHVGDVGRSLDELRRVLRPGGGLFVYNLPQRSSYKEAVIRRLDLGFTHERTYTAASVRLILQGHGFRVVSVRRAGALPHLATGLPARVRRVYFRCSPVAYRLDRALARTPGVNLLGQSLELVAENETGPG